jgi:regulator of replication initiation timing
MHFTNTTRSQEAIIEQAKNTNVVDALLGIIEDFDTTITSLERDLREYKDKADSLENENDDLKRELEKLKHEDR